MKIKDKTKLSSLIHVLKMCYVLCLNQIVIFALENKVNILRNIIITA